MMSDLSLERSREELSHFAAFYSGLKVRPKNRFKQMARLIA